MHGNQWFPVFISFQLTAVLFVIHGNCFSFNVFVQMVDAVDNSNWFIITYFRVAFYRLVFNSACAQATYADLTWCYNSLPCLSMFENQHSYLRQSKKVLTRSPFSQKFQIFRYWPMVRIWSGKVSGKPKNCWISQTQAIQPKIPEMELKFPIRNFQILVVLCEVVPLFQKFR